MILFFKNKIIRKNRVKSLENLIFKEKALSNKNKLTDKYGKYIKGDINYAKLQLYRIRDKYIKFLKDRVEPKEKKKLNNLSIGKLEILYNKYKKV